MTQWPSSSTPLVVQNLQLRECLVTFGLPILSCSSYVVGLKVKPMLRQDWCIPSSAAAQETLMKEVAHHHPLP